MSTTGNRKGRNKRLPADLQASLVEAEPPTLRRSSRKRKAPAQLPQIVSARASSTTRQSATAKASSTRRGARSSGSKTQESAVAKRRRSRYPWFSEVHDHDHATRRPPDFAVSRVLALCRCAVANVAVRLRSQAKLRIRRDRTRLGGKIHRRRRTRRRRRFEVEFSQELGSGPSARHQRLCRLARG